MKKIFFITLIFFVAEVNSQTKLKIEKYTLPNGLQVVLHEDRSVPLVSVNLWYHVGSAREKYKRTGFAHLFEHMMFQGSQNVGDDKHFEMIQDAGGNLNGSTTNDRTNYFETLPSQFLEMALWLEADRMGFLLPAMTQEKLDNQRDVVKNERRQRVDNQPYGRSFETIHWAMYDSTHPYYWPVIGYMEDLSAATLDDIKDFFKTYYAPNNASLVIAGDFNVEQTKKWIEKYFGHIPIGIKIETVKENQATINQNIYKTMEDRVQLPQLMLAFHSSPLKSEDDPVVDVISDILAGGKTSRLYKTLVYEKQIAQSVSAFNYSREISGGIFIMVMGKPNQNLNELKQIVLEEINKLSANGAEAKELQRAKNSVKASYIYQLQSVGGKSDILNSYNTFFGDPNLLESEVSRFEKITLNDVNNIVKKYLTKPFVALSIVPIGKTELEAK